MSEIRATQRTKLGSCGLRPLAARVKRGSRTPDEDVIDSQVPGEDVFR
jgi:hypothetical protein